MQTLPESKMYCFSPGLFSICLMLLIAVPSCVNDYSKVHEMAEMVQPSVAKGKGIEMVYSEDGRVKMRLLAPTMDSYATESPYIEFTEGLQVYFYDPNLNVISQLEADYGIRYEKDLKTIVRQNVVVTNEEGERLETEELIWTENDHLIKSDKYVQIHSQDEIIYGTGLEADENFTHYKILNPAGIIKVDIEE